MIKNDTYIRQIAGAALVSFLGCQPSDAEANRFGFFFTERKPDRNVQTWYWDQVPFIRITIRKGNKITSSTGNLKPLREQGERVYQNLTYSRAEQDLRVHETAEEVCGSFVHTGEIAGIYKHGTYRALYGL